MGREIKRVPVDFDWPVNKVWKGYINPHYKPCPEKGKTCYNGVTAGRKWFEEIIRFLTVAAGDAARPTRNGIYPHPYLQEFPLAVTEEFDSSDDLRAALIRGRGKLKTIPPTEELADLVVGLGARDRKGDPFGHDAIDNWSVMKAIMKAAGVPEDWGICPVCKGECIDPEVYEAHENWKQEEPPTGEGWQVWETVSEGSPITPVFPTREALVEHLVEHGDGWGDPISREAAEAFVTDDGWVPSMVISEGKLHSGIESAAIQNKK